MGVMVISPERRKSLEEKGIEVSGVHSGRGMRWRYFNHGREFRGIITQHYDLTFTVETVEPGYQRKLEVHETDIKSFDQAIEKIIELHETREKRKR